ncbi:Toprim-like [Armatimonadetes bacterium GXS]|nr:Toprim-like [Armatimonadetes bacterium GXS]
MRNANAPHPQGNGRGQGVRTPNLRLADILPHLHGVEKRPDGSYMALCPAHDDNEPSLSLKEENGKLLWHCFRGCSQEAVLEALLNLVNRTAPRHAPQGLTLERYASAKQLPIDRLRAWGCEDAQYQQIPAVRIPYRDTEGKLTAVRYRLALDGGNRFRWRTGDKPTLYGQWRLAEWKDSEVVYLVEGETDTLTLWSAGLPALGIPGATSWKQEWWEPLKQFQRVVVIPDADEAGRQLVQKLAETCPHNLRERVEVLELPEGVKDANELWLQVDADPERFREAIAGLLHSCILLRGCTNAQMHESEPPLLVPITEWLASNDSEQVEYLPLLGVDGLIARGTITLFGASPKGGGKTTVLVHALRDWLRQGLKIVYLTEEPRAVWELRRQRFPELGNPNLIVNNIPRANPYKWAQAIEQVAPDLVIVDTIRRFLPAKDENDSASVSEALAPFVDLAQKLPRTAIIFVHHLRKELPPEVEIEDIAGSHAFVAEVDAVIALVKIRGNPRQRLLKPLAGRLWALTPEPLVLELSEDGSTYAVKGIANEVLPAERKADAKEAILQALQVLGSATAEQIAEYLSDFSKRTVYDALQELYANGQVQREGGGTKGNPYRFRAFVQSS